MGAWGERRAGGRRRGADGEAPGGAASWRDAHAPRFPPSSRHPPRPCHGPPSPASHPPRSGRCPLRGRASGPARAGGRAPSRPGARLGPRAPAVCQQGHRRPGRLRRCLRPRHRGAQADRQRLRRAGQGGAGVPHRQLQEPPRRTGDPRVPVRPAGEEARGARRAGMGARRRALQLGALHVALRARGGAEGVRGDHPQLPRQHQLR